MVCQFAIDYCSGILFSFNFNVACVYVVHVRHLLCQFIRMIIILSFERAVSTIQAVLKVNVF